MIPRPDITRPNYDRDRDNDGRPDRDGRYNPDRPVRPERPSAPIFGANQFVNGRINVGGPRFDRSSWGFRAPPPGDRRGDRHDHGHHDHNWGNHWHQHYVNRHFHDWYRGPWQGQWGGNAYSPVVWAGARYGVGSWWLYGNWGYGQTYVNPYYVVGTGYDYSQPIVINQYVVDDTAPEALRVEDRPPDEERALALFDDGMILFREGRYPEAYARLDAAQRLMPRDPVIHEVKALALFALGRYNESAAVLNALLASSPGMDWKSMSSLYEDEQDYTTQMRRLETYVSENPREPGPIFTLAYHYLVIGENESATRMLRAVVARRPDDLTARRMLDGLNPPQEVAVALPEVADAPVAGAVDLVGAWTAKSPDAKVVLTVAEDGTFTWSAAPQGKPPVTVSGTISANEENLALESKDQGSMLGKVKTLGPDRFQFVMAGTPASDPGLIFERR